MKNENKVSLESEVWGIKNLRTSDFRQITYIIFNRINHEKTRKS